MKSAVILIFRDIIHANVMVNTDIGLLKEGLVLLGQITGRLTC
jgi:hypothetical protein